MLRPLLAASQTYDATETCGSVTQTGWVPRGHCHFCSCLVSALGAGGVQDSEGSVKQGVRRGREGGVVRGVE